MKGYLDLWRRAFDYKGISTLREFWLPFGIHAALAAVMALLFLIGGYAANIAAFILAAFLIISAVPFAALTVRRLHDVGKSGWWYFLWFGLGIGAVVLMVILACSGGGFSVFDNAAVCVYGPPPSDYNPTSTEETDINFDPEDNIEVNVYGPPPMEEITPTAEADESTDFNPSDNLEECVYGPPEWFGITEDAPSTEPDSEDENLADSSEQQALGEPPANDTPEPVEPEISFDPAENIEVDVYGPPEWFGISEENPPPDNISE